MFATGERHFNLVFAAVVICILLPSAHGCGNGHGKKDADADMDADGSGDGDVDVDDGEDMDGDMDADDDPDQDADGEGIPPCGPSESGTSIDTIEGVGEDSEALKALAVSTLSDRAMVVYVDYSVASQKLMAAFFDGTGFGSPVEIQAPPGGEITAESVSACLAGPEGRPVVAFDGWDVEGAAAYAAVGDGTGAFSEAVLVEGDPRTGIRGQPRAICSADQDTAVIVTQQHHDALWLDAWAGGTMIGPFQVLPGGKNVISAKATEFSGSNDVLIAYEVVDFAAETTEIKALVFMHDKFSEPLDVHADAIYEPAKSVAVSRHLGRGLLVFADSSGRAHIARMTGSDLGAATLLEDVVLADDGGLSVDFFSSPEVDLAAVVYETESWDIHVVMDNGTAFAPAVTVGRNSYGTDHMFLRYVSEFNSSSSGSSAFLLFTGDGEGRKVISLSPFDGAAAGELLTVTDDPSYVFAAGEYGGGDTALVAFETISSAEGISTHALLLEDGVLAPVGSVDCESQSWSQGELRVVASRHSARFALIMKIEVEAGREMAVRLIDEYVVGPGLVFDEVKVAALPESDLFLIASRTGADIQYELR